ncbi:MAG: hypothetical protein M1813_005360 [Trichoglossum hirsutum]|nr:MAG: hypothetical protein M1813_005360 [Trichoglossum hirsutum]
MTKRNIKPALEPLEASSAAHADQIQPPVSVDAPITEVSPTGGFAVPPSPTSGKKRRASGPPTTTTTTTTTTAATNATTNATVTPTQTEGVSLSSPPAKKSRTNTPWSPAEEQRLKTMRDAGSSWSEIAKTFPTRTEGSVKKHWYKDMHYAEFAEDESAALLAAIKEYEASKWKVIGQKVGKPAKVG